jgi:ADP-ribose pyrophosphatase YjhB (NUDIX family)
MWESSDDVNFVICKRGYKTSEEKAKWNLPSGYLNWNESGEEAAARELWEECGIEVNPEDIFEIEHSTNPEENKQNVIFRYGIELPGPPKFAGPIDESEILEIRFVTLKDLEELKFAWKQKETIKRLIEKWKQRK